MNRRDVYIQVFVTAFFFLPVVLLHFRYMTRIVIPRTVRPIDSSELAKAISTGMMHMDTITVPRRNLIHEH